LVCGIALIIGFSPVMSVLVAVHGWVAHQFFEVPQLAAIRQTSQVVLLRYPLSSWLIFSGLFFMVSGRLQFETRRFWQVLFAGWAIRAGCWIIGGNLPLVPGDSCHYIETANSVAMGLPSSKHYV
ncbi:MAG: hypothetical protein ACKPJJ_26640, partial [Planctomycetaceae bacterium]